MRNREVRVHISLLAGLGLAGTIACFLSGGMLPGIFALLMAALGLGLALRFARRRYRDIALLTDILAKIATGNYHVDLREYGEGELSILYDELHKVTRTLSRQAENLARDKTWLADTMADLSHQLKTPLTSVSMLADLLADPALPPEKREEFLRGMGSGIQRIRWLIASMLKLSRLDADAVTFRQEAVGVRPLVERAAESLGIPMELKGQRLVLELEDASVTGDLEWLSEAVGNLLKNCVEHTQAGGEIGVRCRDNPLYTQLEVWDNGPGIPADELPHIFERFYRGKNAAPDSAGIGLALSKSIINRHNGSIEATSGPHGGTRFAVKFYKGAV